MTSKRRDFIKTAVTAGSAVALAPTLSAFASSSSSSSGKTGKLYNSLRVDRDVEMTTRDGVILRADIYRPATAGKVPAIVCRTPYDKNGHARDRFLAPTWAAANGFAFVAQDVRGRNRSDGKWEVIGWSGVERNDGYDTVEWLASEPWCNGKIGMIGASYEAGNQLSAARQQPPSLRCIAPQAGGGDNGSVKRSKMMLESIILSWSAGMAVDAVTRLMPEGKATEADLRMAMDVAAHPEKYAHTLPLKNLPTLNIPGAPSYADMLDVLQKASQTWDGQEDILVPALFTNGWYDIGSGTYQFRMIRAHGGSAAARTETKTILGPWSHSTYDACQGEWGFGNKSTLGGGGVEQDHLNYYSRHLRDDDAAPQLANIKYFLMGENEWRTAEVWPPEGTEIRRYYLHSRGKANSSAGDGVLSREMPAASESPDRYQYDPMNPTPSIGLRTMYAGTSTVPGAFNQSRVERREDTLVYTSEPFETGAEVVGEFELHLWIASSAPDTDFIAKWCVVDVDGISRNISDQIIRTRYRDSWDDPTMMEPGRPYELVFNLGPAAYAFRPGERLRVNVASSCFPHWERNMNTGNPPGEDASGVVAQQTIYHDAEHVSYLSVPVGRKA